MQEAFDLAANDCNFKRVSFRDQIEKNTHPLIARDMFIASPLLMESDRVPFREHHGSLVDLQRSHLRRMGPFEFLMTMPGMEIFEIFNADRKSTAHIRSAYVVASNDSKMTPCL